MGPKHLLDVEPVECVFLERVNRFTVKVLVGDHEEKAHLTNTGRLTDILVSGRKCLLQVISGRKMQYRLVGVKIDDDYALIDTILQAKAFERTVHNQLFPLLRGCRISKRAPRIGDSVFDYLIECGELAYIVELKSAVMIGSGWEAMYPDCPTERGRRQVSSLMRLARERSLPRPLIVMIAGFKRARCFKPSRQGDPVMHELLSKWVLSGLPLKAASFYMDSRGSIYLEKPELPLCDDWASSLHGHAL